MLKIDPFEFLSVGSVVSINVGESLSLPFRIEQIEPSRHSLALQLEGDDDSADAVDFNDWRVYMLSLQHWEADSGPVEVMVPTELQELSRRPMRIKLGVLDGTALLQRRVIYRSARTGAHVTLHVAGSTIEVKGDVLDLSVSGLSFSTPAAPPEAGTPLLLAVLLPTGVSVPLHGHLIAAVARGEAGTAWRWNVKFNGVPPVLANILKLFIHAVPQ